MIKEIFPEGHIIFRNKPHTAEFFSLTIDEIDNAGESFIGIVRVDEPDAAYFLFFLKGDAYAAGCIMNNKPMPISIKNCLQHMSTPSAEREITLYKTDPVLLKGMLVFLQREPSIKATTDMIHLNNIFAAIRDDKASAFVVLKKNDMHNFFYFQAGEPKMAHFVDDADVQKGRTIVEQMLLYAYPPDKTSVEAMVFRDIKTTGASDTSALKSFFVSDTMQPEDKKQEPAPAAPAQQPEKKEEKPVRVRIEITDGPQKGNKFNVPLPCTIGRRDADIRIRDMAISKRHAVLEPVGNKIIFSDLESTNGSIVNGKEVKEIELSDSDMIQMGNTTLTIHLVED